MVIADNATFHRSQEVRDFVRSHRHKIRMFFFPTYSPKLNPDEQVWNEIKHRKLQKQPIKNKSDLKRRMDSALNLLKEKTEKVRSFSNFLILNMQQFQNRLNIKCPDIN
jgi:transposase